MKLSILIAIEKYHDKRIEGVSFAESNAVRLAAVLEQHDFATEDRILLINEQATKTAIESRVRRAIKSCLNDDILFVYYAGHSFSRNSVNYLTCTDSDSHDLDHTTIRLDWLLTQFRESDCKQIVFLLDSSEKPFNLIDTQTNIEWFDDTELKRFFEASTNCVCFAACKPSEISYASRKLKSGIWAHHLMEVFDGKILSALVEGSRLTCSLLQAHLTRAIALTLTTTFSSKKQQTPCLYGSQASDVVLMEFAEIFADRKATSNPYSGLIRSVAFWAHESSNVKGLSGFKKGYAIPDRVNISSQTFVAKLAQEQVSQDIDSIFKQLKSAFKFKRTEIRVTDQGDGTGTIITPYFNYSIGVGQDAENPAKVVWHRTIDSIKDSEQVFSDAFASLFEGVFTTVEFTTQQPVNLDALIDSLEALEDERIAIEYDHNATRCLLRIEGIAGEIQVTRSTLRIVHPMPEAPRNLLRSFLAIQNALLGPDGVSMIPIDGFKG